MKCISDELIQKYIDGEASTDQVAIINQHISSCSKCADRLTERKELSEQVERALNEIVAGDVVVPEFERRSRSIKMKPSRVQRLIYATVAACLLVLVFVLSREGNHHQQEVLQVYPITNEFDANRPLSEQELHIEININPGN